MILECPSCSAQFTVPDGALGTEGRRVRCGKCQYMWKAKPAIVALPEVAPEESEEATTNSVPDFDQIMSSLAEPTKDKKAAMRATIRKSGTEDGVLGNFSAPASIKNKRFYIAFYALAYSLVIAVLVWLLLLQYAPERLGYTLSKGFAFEKVQVERMAQLGGDRFTNTPLFTIQGVIRNTSDTERARPNIKVTLKNNTGGEVYSKIYPSPDKAILAGQAVSFKIERLEREMPADTYFAIEMGNRLELVLRNVGDVAH